MGGAPGVPGGCGPSWSICRGTVSVPVPLGLWEVTGSPTRGPELLALRCMRPEE